VRDLPIDEDGLGIPELDDGLPAPAIVLGRGNVYECTECQTEFYLIQLPTTQTFAPITADLEWHSAVHPRCIVVGGYRLKRVDSGADIRVASRPPT
jgi:hypothetical protein